MPQIWYAVGRPQTGVKAQRSRVTIKLIHYQTAAAALRYRTRRAQHHGLSQTVGDMALSRAGDGASLHDRHNDGERAVPAGFKALLGPYHRSGSHSGQSISGSGM